MQPDASPFKAIAWMIASLLSFAVMAVSVRELTGEMHAFQMLFIRSALGVLILLPVLSPGRLQRWKIHEAIRRGARQCCSSASA